MAPSNGNRRAKESPAPASPLRRRATFLNSTTLRVEHLLNYRYSHEAHNITTRLRLTPPDIHGLQRLLSHRLQVAPLPHMEPVYRDEFGNSVIELHHELAKHNLSAAVAMTVENGCQYDDDGVLLPTPISIEAAAPPERFRDSTLLTTPDADLERLGEEVRRNLPAGADDPFDLAFDLSRRVYRAMRYAPGTTGVRTTALEAWSGKQGVCQDYAHILIALCRVCGLPARYVSGFLPGEGAMHAWVEVLLPTWEAAPTGSAEAWYGIDPTHDRWVNERYVVVAVGRDYADVTPTSGAFFGRAPGVLTHHSRVRIEPPSVTPLRSDLSAT